MVSFIFDITNKLLIVESPFTQVTIQQIVDVVREWQDELIEEQIEDFINPSGKQELGTGSGVYVGITLQFRYGWRIKFQDRAGPLWSDCYITGGNIVGDGYTPWVSGTFVNTIVQQSTSAALLSGGADPLVIAAAVWDEDLSTHAINTAGGFLMRALGLAQENQYIDNIVYTGTKATSMRLRIYDSPVNVGTNFGVIGEYDITSAYVGDELVWYKVVKV